MLSSLNRDSKSFVDLSAELNDEHDWKAGTLRTFEHHLDLTAWAYDPLNGLFAIGTRFTYSIMIYSAYRSSQEQIMGLLTCTAPRESSIVCS